MVSTGSFARGDQPRSVPDEGERAWAEMSSRQRAYNEKQAAESGGGPLATQADGALEKLPPDPEHALPDAVTAHFARVFGFAREARKTWKRGDAGRALLEATVGLPDAYVGGAPIKATWKLLGPRAWHVAPRVGVGARKWMATNGLIGAKEVGHHAYIPQRGWGKRVPDAIKNQPWNIKALDPITHRRVHTRATVVGGMLPRFNALERFWHGTTPFAKGLVAGTIFDAPVADPAKFPHSLSRPAPENGEPQDARSGSAVRVRQPRP